MKRKPLFVGLIAVGVVLAMCVATYFLVFKKSPSVATDIGNGVVAYDAPRQLKASVVKNTALPSSGASLAPIYKIGPSGALAKPTRFRLPLRKPLPNTHGIIIVTKPNSGGKWTPLAPEVVKLSNDRRFVEFETDHLSLFGALGENLEELFKAFRKELLDGLSGDFLAEASKPKCQNESTTRQAGYQPTSSHKDTVYWCLGKEKGKVIVKVTNNRRYALIASYKNMKVIDSGPIRGKLEQLARFASGNRVMIFPRETVTLSLDLATGKTASLATEMDGFASALFQLEVGLQTAATILGKLGTKKVNSLVEVLQTGQCTEAVGRVIEKKVSSGEMIAACLNPSQLYDMFGLKGFFVGLMTATGQFMNFMRTSFNAVPDTIRARDKYTLSVTRLAGKPFTFQGMTLVLPLNWRTTRADGLSDYALIGDGNLKIGGYDETGHTIRLFGPKEMKAQSYFESFYGDGAWMGSGGLKPCRGTQLPQYDHDVLERKTVSVGGKTAEYTRSRWKCGRGKDNSPDYTLVSTFEQRTWRMPKQGVWIVDEWSTPGLEDILAKATWR